MCLQKNIFILFLVVSICLFVSCNIINPEEQIPAYIRIDSIGISTKDHPEYGSSSHNITDGWVYVDDQPIGAFELPAKFPVLFDGTHTITIKSGIKVNGISGTRAIYPFYEPYMVSKNLIKDGIITIIPMVTYIPSTVKWKEDFEVGITLQKTSLSDTTIGTTGDKTKVFEGNYSGIINLDAARNFFQCKTTSSFNLPTGDSPVMLEMNYKTNEEITVGLYANSSTQTERWEVLVINKSDIWKKIYINLKNAVNGSTINPDNFQVFFEVTKSSNVQNSEILLDNIKLLYF